MAVAQAKKQTVAGYTNLVDEFRQYNSSDIRIKPYIDPDKPRQNMGLERYGQVLFEGTMLEQQLRCTIINGVTRYVTGLDESAESVKRLEGDQKDAKVKMIRETVSKLEAEIFFNTLKTDDPDFWSKTSLAPNRPDFWSTVSIVVGNEGLVLDPANPHELIKIIAAEAGGFDDIAGSYDDARKASNPPKFYMERRRDARVQESRLKQLRDGAIYELYKTRTEEPQKLFWYAKNLLPIANGYKKTDPIEIWYTDLGSFIEGTGIETDKKKAPEKFLAMIRYESEYTIVRAYVLEAAFTKRLITKADNKIYSRESGTLLGNNLEECVEYLRQPVNQMELDSIQNQIDPIWSR